MQTPDSALPVDDHARIREELRIAEIALKEQREQVAALRRTLPSVPLENDYVFDREAGGKIPLSALFANGEENLIVVHFMYGPEDTAPCPMCTMWADGYNAIAPHVAQNASLVLVARTEIGKFRDFANRRGWKNLRLLSSRNNSFNADFAVESDDGKSQYPGVSVFTRGKGGRIFHFYTGLAMLGDDHYRGIDLMTPVWHLLDLLPGGRGDWMPKLDYTAG